MRDRIGMMRKIILRFEAGWSLRWKVLDRGEIAWVFRIDGWIRIWLVL